MCSCRLKTWLEKKDIVQSNRADLNGTYLYCTVYILMFNVNFVRMRARINKYFIRRYNSSDMTAILGSHLAQSENTAVRWPHTARCALGAKRIVSGGESGSTMSTILVQHQTRNENADERRTNTRGRRPLQGRGHC